jgi:hypothetical protein
VVSPIPPPSFESAESKYDGDGKRVKSIINGTVTTTVLTIGNELVEAEEK